MRFHADHDISVCKKADGQLFTTRSDHTMDLLCQHAHIHCIHHTVYQCTTWKACKTMLSRTGCNAKASHIAHNTANKHIQDTSGHMHHIDAHATFTCMMRNIFESAGSVNLRFRIREMGAQIRKRRSGCPSRSGRKPLGRKRWEPKSESSGQDARTGPAENR